MMVEISQYAENWVLDPEVHFLNHGSFGACPRVVLDEQTELRRQLEREPIQFMVRELEARMLRVREVLGDFVGSDPDDLVLVSNTTAGVNTVLRSLELGPDDELLVTDQEYNACRNALDYAAQRSGARVTVAQIPFPISDPAQVVAEIEAKVTGRTRLLLVDHITSQTGMVMPIAEIVRTMAEHSVDTLVDGAHAPGMVPLDLQSLGATYPVRGAAAAGGARAGVLDRSRVHWQRRLLPDPGRQYFLRSWAESNLAAGRGPGERCDNICLHGHRPGAVRCHRTGQGGARPFDRGEACCTEV